jgi:hypothetical protein
MLGKQFLKIDKDLYCDDRLGIDTYLAHKKNMTLKEFLIKKNDKQL